MPHTRTHTSVFCRKQHSLFNYSWNGQLMPPHKTSRAHICSAFNQCVPQIALPAAPHSIVLILPRSLSLSIVIPIHSTSFPFPFPIPFPFTLSSSSSLSSSSFTLVSMAQTARTGIFTMYLSSPPHTHTHTYIIESIIHHPSRNWSDLSALFRLKIKRLVRSSRELETIEAHQRQTMACFAFSALRVYLSAIPSNLPRLCPQPQPRPLFWPWPRAQYPRINVSSVLAATISPSSLSLITSQLRHLAAFAAYVFHIFLALPMIQVQFQQNTYCSHCLIVVIHFFLCK